jgi:hypothetical protein
VATMLDQTPELRKMTIHIGTLSKKDMWALFFFSKIILIRKKTGVGNG